MTAGLAVNASRSAQAAPTVQGPGLLQRHLGRRAHRLRQGRPRLVPAGRRPARLLLGGHQQLGPAEHRKPGPVQGRHVPGRRPADRAAGRVPAVHAERRGVAGLPRQRVHHQPVELELVLQHLPRHRLVPDEHLGTDPGHHARRQPHPRRHPEPPGDLPSSISEWYSWSNDLRQNPNIDILASVDPSSFPVGTDPNQSWYGGYYPLMWSNRKYKMLYANFGHNAMNYSTNTGLSSTFDSAQQNQLLIDGLHWLAGVRHRPADHAPAVRRHLADRLVHAWSTGPAASAWTPAPPATRQRHRDPAVRLQQQHRAAVPVRSRQAAGTCGSTTATTAPR